MTMMRSQFVLDHHHNCDGPMNRPWISLLCADKTDWTWFGCFFVDVIPLTNQEHHAHNVCIQHASCAGAGDQPSTGKGLTHIRTHLTFVSYIRALCVPHTESVCVQRKGKKPHIQKKLIAPYTHSIQHTASHFPDKYIEHARVKHADADTCCVCVTA